MNRKLRSLHAIGGIALLSLVLASCGPRAETQAPPPPEVGVVVIAPQAYEHIVRLPGRISAYEISEVRPQIGGIVRTRNFREGAAVRAGQVLYEIDPAQARASYADAQAASSSAQARFERYERLIDINGVSRQEFDDARAAAQQARAALDAARLNLGYTSVTAPISGVIGASSVTPGALATPSQPEPFAVIQQIDRVYVDMTRSSAELLQMRGGNANARARVRIIMPDGEYFPVDGELQFSDVTVNEATGAVTLRALFNNPSRVLLPGMFVNAEVAQGTQADAILAPQQGVTRNARGQATALVVNAENVVEERILETGAAAGNQWVVLSGLNPGDRLIVEGVQRVQPGATANAVPIQSAAETAPAQGQEQGQQGAQESETLRGRQGG